MSEPSDTHPDIERIIIEGYRRMPPLKKLQRVASLNSALDQLAVARIKSSHSSLSDHELRLRLASLSLERDTMVKVFDWDPHIHGY